MKNCARANFNYAIFLESNLANFPVQEKKATQEKIIHHYKKSINISNRSYKAFINLGKFYMSLGEHQKALALFEKVADLNPQLSEPYFLLGKYYLSLENFPKNQHLN